MIDGVSHGVTDGVTDTVTNGGSDVVRHGPPEPEPDNTVASGGITSPFGHLFRFPLRHVMPAQNGDPAMAPEAVSFDTLEALARLLVTLRQGQTSWTPKRIGEALGKASREISSDPELLIRASVRAALLDYGPARIVTPDVIARPGLCWEGAYASPLAEDGSVSRQVERCARCHFKHPFDVPCYPRDEDRRTADDARFKERALEAIRPAPAEPIPA